MMQQLSDERLVAFLDGECSEAEYQAIETALQDSDQARTRLSQLSEATLLVREAFDEMLTEAVPERLLAACRAAPPGGTAPLPSASSSAQILSFRPKPKPAHAGAEFMRRNWKGRNWWQGVAAASVIGLVFGASGVYLFGEREPQIQSGTWLDNIAGYHNLFAASATTSDGHVFDALPGAEKAAAIDIRAPDLKAWGLNLQGTRKIVMDGKPAYQIFYSSDNKELGPINLFITASNRPDVDPSFDRRDGVNMLFWRHAGHGFAIVGQANKGWMWGLSQDISYQLRAI